MCRGLFFDFVVVEVEMCFGYCLCGVGVEGLCFWFWEEFFDLRFRFRGLWVVLLVGFVLLMFVVVVGFYLVVVLRLCFWFLELWW